MLKINSLMAENTVTGTDQYTAVESFWHISVSELHTLILRAGFICSKSFILENINDAKGNFFLPIKGVRKLTGNRVADLLVATIQGGKIINDESVYFGFIMKY